MSRKYKFLFVPLDGVGHFQACIGIASILKCRGHSVVFAATKAWKGKLWAMGFEEKIYHVSENELDSDFCGVSWGELLTKIAPFFVRDTIELLENYYLPVWEKCIKQIKHYSPQFTEIMNTVKPDVVIVDNVFRIPAIMDSGTPWILLISITPLGISKENVPPAFCGYETAASDETLRYFYEFKVAEVFKDLKQDYRKWLLENGSKSVEFNFPFGLRFSPFANIYMYPKELDYLILRPNPPNFYQFDSFFKTLNEEFEIPEKLKTGDGKLIYFSMGSFGCVEVNLMRRLIGILSKSPNKFIVSKGPRGDEIELGDNMWGANSVPQTSVIPLVDLVITHGGNNTVTETFYFGKRLLVLPLVFDQLDNAQRIYETGHGLKFHPYKVTEKELLDGIETLLADELLDQKMISISKRIQAAKPQEKAADLIEKISFESKFLFV